MLLAVHYNLKIHWDYKSRSCEFGNE